MSPYGVTGPQWVNQCSVLFCFISYTNHYVIDMGNLQGMIKSHEHSLFQTFINSAHYKAWCIHAITLTTIRYRTCLGATRSKAPWHSKISAVNILWHCQTTKIFCIRQLPMRYCDVLEVSPWQTLFTSIWNTNVSKKFNAFCASFAIFGCSPNKIIKNCCKMQIIQLFVIFDRIWYALDIWDSGDVFGIM